MIPINQDDLEEFIKKRKMKYIPYIVIVVLVGGLSYSLYHNYIVNRDASGNKAKIDWMLEWAKPVGGLKFLSNNGGLEAMIAIPTYCKIVDMLELNPNGKLEDSTYVDLTTGKLEGRVQLRAYSINCEEIK